jgi:lipopolysaccharide/colanic/teichoic acid biosynthesis glycosyltransferase
MIYSSYIKRIIDFILSLILTFILSPVFIIITIILIISNKGKPFFLQKRPGKNVKIFTVIKFKTMNDKCDSDGNLLPDAERLTAFGSFVRKTSIDEIPQLLNVIKGDMGLIGPRPLLVEYLPLYDNEQMRRHTVRPGITGWAQVNGRNAISWDKRFQYDIWYIDHLSFRLDMKIFWMTVLKIFKSEGINQEGHVTMEKFKGNRP